MTSEFTPTFIGSHLMHGYGNEVTFKLCHRFFPERSLTLFRKSYHCTQLEFKSARVPHRWADTQFFPMVNIHQEYSSSVPINCLSPLSSFLTITDCIDGVGRSPTMAL